MKTKIFRPAYCTRLWAFVLFVVLLGSFEGRTEYLHVGEAISDEAAQLQQWRDAFPYFKGQAIMNGADHKNAGFERDLLRIQRLMQDPGAALAELENLENQVANIVTEDGVSASEALEKALRSLETHHYFPEARIVPLGILPSKQFMDMPARGFVMADVGAGLVHGEFAHRIQWAIIMNNFDKAPEDWNNTPFELFTEIGRLDAKLGDAKMNTGAKFFRNVWSHLFDQKGIDSLEVENNTRHPDGKVLKPDGYRHPDRLTADMVKGVSEVSALPSISKAVRERFQERKSAYDRIQNDLKIDDSTIDNINRTNDEVANLVLVDLKKQGYVNWDGEPKLLIHKDDLVAADKETEAVRQARIKLSREFWGKDSVIAPSNENERQLEQELASRRIRFRRTPSPPVGASGFGNVNPPPPPLPSQGQARSIDTSSSTSSSSSPPPLPAASDATAINPDSSAGTSGPPPNSDGKSTRKKRH